MYKVIKIDTGTEFEAVLQDLGFKRKSTGDWEYQKGYSVLEVYESDGGIYIDIKDTHGYTIEHDVLFKLIQLAQEGCLEIIDELDDWELQQQEYQELEDEKECARYDDMIRREYYRDKI